jgi:MFS family permease
VKVVATTLFIFFLVEYIGRKLSLFISAIGMGVLFFIVGALLKTHPPPATSANSSPGTAPAASKAMAAMIYIYVCFYSMGWGPLPWVYVSDIFPTRTRHYGLAVASASQWLWSKSFSCAAFLKCKWLMRRQTSSYPRSRRLSTRTSGTRCS